MFFPLFYWVVLPLLAAWALVTVIKRAPRPVPPDVAALLAAQPLPPKAFGAACRDEEGLKPLGVFEKLLDASDAAYRARAEAQGQGRRGAFLVFDASGAVLEEIDA